MTRPLDRRSFVAHAGILAAASVLPRTRAAAQARPQVSSASPATPDSPELILVNARVLTMDSAQPRAEAFAVKFGRFVAVGSNADVRALARPGTPIIDAAGMTVLPGFIDCHCHPRGMNELYEANANVRSVKEIQEALRASSRARHRVFGSTPTCSMTPSSVTDRSRASISMPCQPST
jgi:predicted amidohydrolase YtcJ